MDVIMAIVWLIVALAIYLLPSYIAMRRKHVQVLPIFVLNLFTGWTAIGWLGALIWCVSANVKPNERKVDETDRRWKPRQTRGI